MDEHRNSPDAEGRAADEACRYLADPGEVLADDLDGEIVLLHLATGNYFSLVSAGAAVWRTVSAGGSLAQAVDTFGQCDAEERDSRVRAVASFLEELVREGLIAERGDEPAAADEIAAAAAEQAWETPELQKYTDMQDLLLLDPIHEVDEAGWPARREPGN